MSKKEEKKIKVWDLPTRLFHWVLVIAFAVSSYSAFQDKYGDFAAIHLWSGFTILALIVWRILWGFFGSETSRFTRFLKSPRAAFTYAKSLTNQNAPQTLGHNPLGGYSVVLMLLLLLAQAGLGLFASDGMFFDGPFSGYASDYTSNITELHETLGYVLFGLVGLHVLVILFYWIWKKVNLILPMITGNSSVTGDVPQPRVGSKLIALILAGTVTTLLYYQIF